MKKFLLTAGLVAGISLGGCTTSQIQQAEAQIQDAITAATSIACGVIPTANSILAVVGTLYPGLSLIALAGPALQAVETDICSAVPPAASVRYRALPLKTGLPGTIGQSTHGVVVTGWRSR